MDSVRISFKHGSNVFAANGRCKYNSALMSFLLGQRLFSLLQVFYLLRLAPFRTDSNTVLPTQRLTVKIFIY